MTRWTIAGPFELMDESFAEGDCRSPSATNPFDKKIADPSIY